MVGANIHIKRIMHRAEHAIQQDVLEILRVGNKRHCTDPFSRMDLAPTGGNAASGKSNNALHAGTDIGISAPREESFLVTECDFKPR
jgi:hypothetical protein